MHTCRTGTWVNRDTGKVTATVLWPCAVTAVAGMFATPAATAYGENLGRLAVSQSATALTSRGTSGVSVDTGYGTPIAVVLPIT